MRNKTTLSILAVIFTPLLTFGQSKLETANTQFFNLKPVDAKRIYEQIRRGSIQDEKIAAGKQLAQIHWKLQDEEATGLLAQAEEKIRKGLESNSKDAAISLVKGLSGSRFFDYAVMTMFQHNLDFENTADLADIYHYYSFLNDMEGLDRKYSTEKAAIKSHSLSAIV